MMPPREPHDHDLDANHVHRGPPGHVWICNIELVLKGSKDGQEYQETVRNKQLMYMILQVWINKDKFTYIYIHRNTLLYTKVCQMAV